MKLEIKIAIVILIDLLLLIGIIANCLYWFDVSKTLKTPCGKCAQENERVMECLTKPIPLETIEQINNNLNLSENS